MDAVEKANAERQKRWCVCSLTLRSAVLQKCLVFDIIIVNLKGEGPESWRGDVCSRLSGLVFSCS